MVIVPSPLSLLGENQPSGMIGMFVPEITVFGRHNTFYQQRVTTHASSLENAIGKGAFQLFQFNGNFCFRSQALDVVISQLILSREL